MKILKASAGSGKTYRLAHKYIDTLLSSDDRFVYRHILAVTFTNKATAEMKARILNTLHEEASVNPRARRLLLDILHDYSAFSISTIDRFFQLALKSFSREIGYFADYQIELDRNSLITESMDRILDSLTEDQTELMEWFRINMADNFEQGQKLSIDRSLYDMGQMLKSEEHRELAEKIGFDASAMYTKQQLSQVRKECSKVISDFSARARQLGIAVTPSEKIPMPSKKAFKAGPPELAELFGEPYRLYCTMWMIKDMIYSLGLAGEFYRTFDELLAEKNLMCLDESNKILRDIIGESDTPFVYEKIGTRFDHFLLDEFQDTSRIQWQNFLPLLKDSEDRGGDNLIVGDVKQSIYRWRNSDWALLGRDVHRAFPEADVETLDSNWRSCRSIVEFNNSFFEYAASYLGLSDIYSDVRQKVRSSDSQSGCVHLSFTDDQHSAVLDSVLDAVSRNARYGDIAVLVRDRKHGAEVAGILLAAGIPVISDDSLNLKSSSIVRRLVSLLSCINDPGDSIGKYLASSLDIVIPENYHSLLDLCEALLRELKRIYPDSFAGETLFIQAFLDELQSWVAVNSADMGRFLKHWDESEFFIGCPEDADAVRILTIHKSKGLEYPYVIFPYADKVNMFKAGTHWCALSAPASGLGIDRAAELIYPVQLSSSSENSFFNDEYNEEKSRQLVDNMNVFYVALTRARCELHVIAKSPSKKCVESVRKGKPEFGNFSEILYGFCGGYQEYITGDPYSFCAFRDLSAAAPEDFPGVFDSIPIADRLKPSEAAADFFGPDGVTAGVEASPRLNGIVLHDILSAVTVPEDLDVAVRQASALGLLSVQEADSDRALLSERIASHPEWFRGRCLNEVSLFSADGRECRPDRVILSDDETIVIDYKFGEEKGSHFKQVRSYVDIYRAMNYPNVQGYIWYVPEDRVVSV